MMWQESTHVSGRGEGLASDGPMTRRPMALTNTRAYFLARAVKIIFIPPRRPT